ncbi:hypothetical protein BDP81DRAFT_79940 [Colletotrichum phormii]|uniref:Uncharacterized protein n=1 Tax=Colletotrichum phormii TaxID=359342 RepID=A0AAJ0EM46_9PEZI|nr:uncharacterized protein BDP81DRAFT_79940 [Colletotrichum phormii]KAK1654244.1 hypothetical protein BDP81DRAFT_79940 [Colletotrichum phormii]
MSRLQRLQKTQLNRHLEGRLRNSCSYDKWLHSPPTIHSPRVKIKVFNNFLLITPHFLLKYVLSPPTAPSYTIQKGKYLNLPGSSDLPCQTSASPKRLATRERDEVDDERGRWEKSLVVERPLLHISPTDPSRHPISLPLTLPHHRHQLRQNNKSYAYPHGIMGTIYKNGNGSPIQEKKNIMCD